jgi:hypothetical protein
MTSEEAIDACLAVQDEVQSLLRARKYDESCALLTERRDEAMRQSENELAADLSTLLATCLTITGRDEEALIAAQAAEVLDPSSIEAKLCVVRLLLHSIGDPERARAKAEQVLSAFTPEDRPFRYGGLALLGTARARCGDLAGAVDVFHEMTTEEMLGGLVAADYVGVFDLQVVTELVRAGVGKDDCRRYLRLVQSVPNPSPALGRQLDALLAAVEEV